VSLQSTHDFVSKLLNNKRSRDAYVYEHIRNGIPFQLRAMREQRDWTQADLAKAANTGRTTITRLENPNNERLTIKTLLELASAFDVALLIKFVPFSRLLKEYEDVSSDALNAGSITDEEEVKALNAWAAERDIKTHAANASDTILREIKGKGNTTPQQTWLRFVHEVTTSTEVKTPTNDINERRREPADQPNAELVQTQQDQLLTTEIGGQRRASSRG